MHTDHVQTDAQRLVKLNGTRNLRDVGGYPTHDQRRTRWRTLFRSDCLDRLDDVGQAWLIGAGLRTIIDLRDNVEITERPNVFAGSTALAYRRVPFWEEPPKALDSPDVSEGYIRELHLLGDRLAVLAEEVLAIGTLPALIHCAAGKDRTGLAIAVLLDAVGVKRDVIAEDYALSGACLGPDFVAETREWVLRKGFDWAIWAHLSETPAERMLKTLDYLDRQFGGVQRYLVDHGLPEQRFAELRELLTEPV